MICIRELLPYNDTLTHNTAEREIIKVLFLECVILNFNDEKLSKMKKIVGLHSSNELHAISLYIHNWLNVKFYAIWVSHPNISQSFM